ncbi:hypothetical protein [uncultured Amphritea sp.]|uniref:hypothetical protein n=1 Tax=uncultured Amphritea sp. TaxID=981605 RepID=UPI0025EA02DC|nr:hypothetical protein [uncultured Amphritea sp.]
MSDSSPKFRQECLARHLLSSTQSRRDYFEKNPKQVDLMVDLMRQEQARRLAKMTHDEREEWYSRQHLAARDNKNRQRYLVDITQRLESLTQEGKTNEQK